MLVQVGEGVHRVSGGGTSFYLIEESGKYNRGRRRHAGRLALLGRSPGELGAKPEAPRRGAAHPRAL